MDYLGEVPLPVADEENDADCVFFQEDSQEIWTSDWAEDLSVAYRDIASRYPFFDALSFGDFCAFAYKHTSYRGRP